MERIPDNVGIRGYDHKAVSDATRAAGGGESMVQQQFTEEVDINVIVKRFGLVPGSFPQSVVGGVYGDFTGISDYDSALETIARTQERFMQLPAPVREQFQNDPARLVEFAANSGEESFRALFVTPEASVPVVDPGDPPPAS